MTNEVMPIERAQKEVDSWLDYRRVRQSKRDAAKAFISSIAEAVQYGLVSFNESTGELTQRLEFPVDGFISELVYKPRLTVADQNKHVSATKNANEIYQAYIAAATNQGLAQIQRMDMADYEVAFAIVNFF